MDVEIIIKKICVSYDPNTYRIESVSYSTTIPREIPLKEAAEIIEGFVSEYLRWSELINNSNKARGKLIAVTEDIGSDMYCFSVSGKPRIYDDEFVYQYYLERWIER